MIRSGANHDKWRVPAPSAVAMFVLAALFVAVRVLTHRPELVRFRKLRLGFQPPEREAPFTVNARPRNDAFTAALRESLIRYRQHGDNSVGAYDAGSLTASAKKLANKEKVSRIYESMFSQADCFAEYYRDRLAPKQYDISRAYGSMSKKGKLSRWATVIRYGFWKNTLIRNLGQFLAI